jgi:FkbM family methyltransferase
VFVLEQYHYQRGGVTIGAPSDGIVIDCGACWGDTSIYFADRVGPKGKVYALEFVKDNLDVLNQNRNVSGYMADRIEVVEKAASHTSGQTYPYTSRGPSTSIKKEIKSGQEQRTALTITIDDLVISKGMPRVDFIKMDIEGSELDALKGARKTIEQYKPRLAISLYHKQNDFFEIPEYLHEVNPDYEFYIDHFSIHQEETVLFARAKNG